MNAGRELDALVEEYVMGRTRDTIYYSAQGREWITETLPLRSTDIAAAWEVMQHFICLPDGGAASVAGDRQTHYYASCATMQMKADAHANSAPLAICLAALRAVGFDIKTK